jgi:hypothetical protein
LGETSPKLARKKKEEEEAAAAAEVAQAAQFQQTRTQQHSIVKLLLASSIIVWCLRISKIPKIWKVMYYSSRSRWMRDEIHHHLCMTGQPSCVFEQQVAMEWRQHA